MDLKAPCPVCGNDCRNVGPSEYLIDGKVITVPPAFAGALDYSPYVLLQLMHREWCRKTDDEDSFSGLPEGSRPARQLLVALTFWTYFESPMGWFYESATQTLPVRITGDLLRRYNFIGARLDRLHRVLFDSTYEQDLDLSGFAPVRQHLELIQKQRNAFMHGNPQSITDSLVEETAAIIPRFHEAWIHTFNRRCARHR
jgi:hypothetical protein